MIRVSTWGGCRYVGTPTYTSCPLVTEYGKVLLAEFKYGGEPKETFNDWFGIDQAIPRRAFYHLKKDFFPWVYCDDRLILSRVF